MRMRAVVSALSMARTGLVSGMVIALLSALPARAVRPSDGEIATARQWAHAKLYPGEPVPSPESWIEVLANNDPVQTGARNCRPLRLGDRSYSDGLFCHAVSDVRVRLAGEAEAFEALIGVDANEQTGGGRGSVQFRVRAGGDLLYESEVLKGGMAPVPITVALGGAREFSLEVGDGGDGIACDQADWALARVRMRDGSVVRLGDLPIVDAHLPAVSEGLPFSFTYGGKPYSEAARWERTDSSRPLDRGVTEKTIRLFDAATGLEVRCVGRDYPDYPVVEWTVWLKNTSTADTPMIENLLALDSDFAHYAWPEGSQVGFDLHHFTGSPCRADDFAPHVTRLAAGSKTHLGGAGGRPTNSDLCYMNLEWPSEGVILGIGWPGQWAADFERDAASGLRLRVGQETTRFTLHPGEEVRTPLIALLFWRGDWIRGQNLWRAWMRDHNLPRPGGKLPPPQFVACSSHWFGEMIGADEASQIEFIDRYLEEGLKLDYWWMDAGWYVNETGWPHTGTWEVDTKRYPRGLRAITDHGRERGVKSIVWFEPERVTPNTWLYDTHPEWLLGPDGGQKLLNLGNPEAREWLIEHVDGLLNSEGIDLYRQDFNMDPLEHWRMGDAPDRQGITENHHVTGYLAYWDELRRRHPDMLIDSCASGGRRNDLETMRRAVPLLRSDYILQPTGNQGHTYGLSFWLPYQGTGAYMTSAYDVRSAMVPSYNSCMDLRRTDHDYDLARRLLAEWRDVTPTMVEGDYYPLTPYTLDESDWMGWQFDRPDEGRGIVQAFRRRDSIYEMARLPLHGLEPAARYRVTDADTGESVEMIGDELLGRGLPVTIPDRPGAVLYRYERL